ncbi:DNA/RNA non-specific endonuclease [uncultured Alistipes sp.]|uniref:DNA/RNA non-specific endonuclease n=1 Tax=uncultured Alistipes sp. TaxID=538949 RepID=UPI0025E661BD|nr:DNA/RNA non-specific endonuclease [uncultured Alistipes sp.]
MPGVAAFFAVMALAFTACSSDSNGGSGGPNSVEWDLTKTVHPDKEGEAILIVTGKTGTPWTAEIISGSNWISFNRATAGGQTVKTGTVGTSLAEKNQYVYYWPNRTNDERSATIRFTFEGGAPEELTLTQYSTSDASGDVYAKGQNLSWPEVPAHKENSNYTYVTHFAEMNGSGNTTFNARNYTLCHDKTKLAAWWVAYPLHSAYTGTGRIETWAYDPKLSDQDQPNLSRGYTNGTTWNRGHQIPNADRSKNAVMQAQTFYFSNMTPQNGPLNSGPWADLEKKARDKWMCSNTLYVVTGAYWSGSSTQTTTDRDGKQCPIPDYYFKVFARTVKGNVRQRGDKLGSYPANQLMSIGFWVKNASGQGAASGWVKSVKEIEDLTGFEFFPTLPAEVKTQKDATSWGY